MYYHKIQILTCLFAIPHIVFRQRAPHPLANLNTQQLIQHYNYSCELHTVTTTDGYILTLHRIPRPGAKPLILSHGLFQSAAEFVFAGPRKGLAFALADAGYDVWMDNTRGTPMSRKHVHYDADVHQEQYFNYTLHEMSVYDVTANIDYVLNYTKREKLHYFGYSQGTSKAFIALADQPHYNAKLQLFTILAPAVFVENGTNIVINFVSRNVDLFQYLFETFKIHEFFATNSWLVQNFKFMCNLDNSLLLQALCLRTMGMMQGGSKQIDVEMLPVLLSNMPTPVSTKHLVHCFQIGRDFTLRKFNYGWENNRNVYDNVTNDMHYDFRRITTPSAIFYLKNDELLNPQNIHKFQATLPNIVKTHMFPLENFHHFDIVIGKDASKLIYPEIINNLDKY